MLKKPERFSLFIKTFSQYLAFMDDVRVGEARKVFMQHLCMLLKVVSEVNHKELAKEIIYSLVSFDRDEFWKDLVYRLTHDPAIRVTMQKLVAKICEERESINLKDVSAFRSSKRGRKPSFAKSDDLRTIEQVTVLGVQTVAKAS
jgi:hypothetical protein